jgi:hypothetical protein
MITRILGRTFSRTAQSMAISINSANDRDWTAFFRPRALISTASSLQIVRFFV